MKKFIYILLWNIMYYLAFIGMVFLNRTFLTVPTTKNELYFHMVVIWITYIVIGCLLGKLYATTFSLGKYTELLLFAIVPFCCIIYYFVMGAMTNIYFSNIFRFSALALGVEIIKHKIKGAQSS